MSIEWPEVNLVFKISYSNLKKWKLARVLRMWIAWIYWDKRVQYI